VQNSVYKFHTVWKKCHTVDSLIEWHNLAYKPRVTLCEWSLTYNDWDLWS